VINPAAESVTRRGIAAKGIEVVFSRLSGMAPNVVSFSAQVKAIVQNYVPDSIVTRETGYSASQIGAITQGDRQVIVMAKDLRDRRFPLPPQKHDKILILETGELLDVTRVDVGKRALAGAIELFGTGVA